jgi:RNA polymerase sigma-70 factor (ECF subfamily)
VKAAATAMNQRDPEDADLVAGLRAQDPGIAGPLWTRFASAIFGMLRRMLGPQAAIDDAVQVVLLCVFRRGRRLSAGADLRRLVVGVTARIAQSELRRRKLSWLTPKARARSVRDRRRRDLSGPEADNVMRFYRLLDRLSIPDRVAFALHYIEGFEVLEVAAVLGASRARTEGRLRRSLERVSTGIDADPALRQIGAATRA